MRGDGGRATSPHPNSASMNTHDPPVQTQTSRHPMAPISSHSHHGVVTNRGEVGDERVRPPRMMHGPERAVRPYSHSEAMAQRVLLELRDGCYLHESLLMCIRIGTSELLVLTEGRLLLASASTFKTTRQYPLLAIQVIALWSDCVVAWQRW